MIKSHPKSKIIRVHINSRWCDLHLDPDNNKGDVILQVEYIENDKYNVLVEYVAKEDYDESISKTKLW